MDNNAIGDTLFSQTDEVLVLSDEVHNAYSHLSFSGNACIIEEGGRGENRDERLWMKFLREEPKIKRHIGFTGTPYNQDEYFADVIYNYSINDAIEEKCIKNINPIIHTKIEGEKETISQLQKFEQILITHDENKENYSYKLNGNSRLKPITIFINPTCARAKANTQEFIKALCEYLKNTRSEYRDLSIPQLDSIAREKVICVISKPTDDDYQEKLEQIEELNPEKPGGKVEFIFAVNKLSEGWDVDNVYQIVPMEERVFKSKLLISQVLGRGLRLPRKVPNSLIQARYPVVTVTNHEKFAEHIKELLFAVTECETRFISRILKNDIRREYNFELLNLEYLSGEKIEDAPVLKQDLRDRTLILTPHSEKLKLTVDYLLDQKIFNLSKEFYTLDEIASKISDRFKNHQFENKYFDFGNSVIIDKLPGFDDIKKVIEFAMKNSGFKDDKLSKNNSKKIDLFFNQFLPQGTKKIKKINIDGNFKEVKTENMDASSVRSGELDKYTSIFISEDYQQELEEENKFVIDYLGKRFKKRPTDQLTLDYFIPQEKSDYFRQLIKDKPLFVVNTSVLKTPQNLVILSHEPERLFVFNLIKNAKYITSWIKSRDMGFYSIDYEFFKGGKDRTRRSFNPDFFIKINLEGYIDRLISNNPEINLTDLHQLQDKGINNIIRAVEIKSDEDQEEVTRAKEKWGKDHFKRLNEKLRSANPIDFSDEFQDDVSTLYTFELLRPMDYDLWFSNLQKGVIWIK
jgi:type III restriction enzyme